MTVQILVGDCRDVLRSLPDDSVHCVVTSPPYWGLRDYGVDGQIGLEQSPFAFIDEMVAVFRELRRVLRSDGTCWMNMGDSYAGSGRGGNPTEETSTLQGGQDSQRASMVKRTRGAGEVAGSARDAAGSNFARRATRGGAPSDKSTLRGNGHVGGGPKLQRLAPVTGLMQSSFKQKDLMGMPWRVAFALQADGWYLRQDIIWSKPNPMPESVRDRCTKAHEYLFLLSKSERYHFDQQAILEPVSPNTHARLAQDVAAQIGSERAHAGGKTNGNMKAVGRQKMAEAGSGIKNNDSFASAVCLPVEQRNKRSVWTVNTQGYSEAHFATFPPALIEPCIKAGCPTDGVVLDPFGGAGTTGMVASRLQRNAILIELNPEYAAMAERRIHKDLGLFASVTRQAIAAEARADA